MLDLEKPIPTIKFPENKIPVGSPIDESMMYIDNYFICESKYNHWIETGGKPIPGSSPHIIARKTVVQKLLDAERLLPKGYRFKIYDAYRPIAVQQALWDYFRAQKETQNPDKTPKEIDKITAFCVSFPSYNVLEPSLHNTGGAVDLTIIDENGNELDMGCEFDEFSNKSWTNHFEQDCYNGENNDVVRDNRRLLYNVMTAVGFTNLPSEWWHFDYGDDKWAQLNHTAPLYAGILDARVKDSEPYPNMDKIRAIDLIQQKHISSIIEIRDQCGELAKELASMGFGV
jgi:D-alanyl-D-alanine dipeptidase